MADVGRARSLTVQDFVPSAGWMEYSNGHYLLMDLRVSGARLSSDKCLMRFKQDFILPPESDRSRISGKFDGDIFYVTVPTIPKPPKIHKGDDNDIQSDHDNKEKGRRNSEIGSFGEDFVRKRGKEPCQFKRVIEMLKRNNGIVITALVAFWLGVLVSRLFQCAGHKEGV